MGSVEVMRPDDMEVDDGPEVMFDAGIDALVEDGPVGFNGRPGAVPEVDLVNGQPDIVKAQRGKPGGVLVVILNGVAIADLAEPVADVDAAQHGEAVGRSSAGEGGGGPGLTGRSRGSGLCMYGVTKTERAYYESDRSFHRQTDFWLSKIRRIDE